jgi:HlyD family secretion protein
LIQAQTSRLNPDIQMAKIAGLKKQLSQANYQLTATQAEVKNAQAAQQEIAAKIDEFKILSPIDGTVIARTVEPGVVVTPGKTLLTLVNLNDVYLRGYIPEGKIGEIRVGQSAKVFLDSAPERPLKATVIAIDPQASFTPENIYFKEDRVTQVFGVKLGIENPAGFAKPGMPADGEIILKQP